MGAKSQAIAARAPRTKRPVKRLDVLRTTPLMTVLLRARYTARLKDRIPRAQRYRARVPRACREPLTRVRAGQPGQPGPQAQARLLGDDQHLAQAADRVGAGQGDRAAAGPAAVVTRAGEPGDQPAQRARPRQPDRHRGRLAQGVQPLGGGDAGGPERLDRTVPGALPGAVPRARLAELALAARADQSLRHEY